MAKRGGFPGMGGGMNMNAMIKQAQKMQQQMAKAQEEIAEMEHTATVGGGVVSATVKGTNSLLSVKISPEAMDPDDVEMLEDLIVSAVNEALKQAENENAEIMKKMTGANMPGMF
ncbi:MAG: YbaB/EbfC family nucleoid-associated protein [Butyricicoccus sp.]|jgi:DNA-binding YbaB/EbfC family protein|nr:YbaB/EbfC family nucleoid-associated protein [Clostridiales bacterium]